MREGERTEDERMGWVFCERKRERTAPEREGGESQVERREKKLLKTKYTCYSARVNLHGYYSSLKNLEDFTHF